MEEISNQADEVFNKIVDIEKQWLVEFENAKLKLQHLLLGHGQESNVSLKKKKVKRLSVIVDSEYDGESSHCDENKNSLGGKPSITNGTARKETITSNNDEVPTTGRRQTRKDSEASNQNQSCVAGDRTFGLSETSSSRPSRAAKLKAEANLKEPSLNNKLRQTSDQDLLTKTLIVKVKKEKLSEVNLSINSEGSKENQGEIGQSKKRKSDDDEKDNNLGEGSKVEEPSKKVKMDDSLLIVPTENGVISILSDEDAAEKMPPPQALPRKKKVTRNQSMQNEHIPMRSTRSKVKKEKLSMEISQNQTKSTNDTANCTEIPSKEIKKEQDTDTVSLISSSNGKKGRPKKAFKHRPIKEEKPDESENCLSAETTTTKSHETDSVQTSSVNKNNPKKNVRNGSTDSVYEDAVAVQKETETVDNKLKKAVVMIEKIKPQNEDNQNMTKVISPADATFVSAKDAPSNMNNETYVATEQQTTFVVDKPNEIHDKPNTVTDATFCMEDDKTKNTKKDKLKNSLITDDESFDEPAPKPKHINPKLRNELFSPFIQSPVKKKVEAFEKKAVEGYSPFVARQTRTKTKTQDSKENKEPMATRSATKPSTPVNSSLFNRLFTPQQQSHLTTAQNNSLLKKLPNSTSKVMSIQKPATKVTTGNKPPSLSRENSVEDLKRGINKLQQLAEEKRKKREQKQQSAAQAREAKEKERADKLKKMLQEREEKSKKKMMEAEHKKHLEEINKNLKLAEEKREAAKRLEKQKQLEIEKLEAAKRERDMIENAKILKAKEALQAQKLENMRQMQKQKAREEAKGAYDFEMLHTDDSTDDEDRPSGKRPPPPGWSLPAIRKVYIKRQLHVPTSIIDNFFSVQPTTIDLREIFPKIDPRHLKRNSSMIWRTPPRYSQLPKY